MESTHVTAIINLIPFPLMCVQTRTFHCAALQLADIRSEFEDRAKDTRMLALSFQLEHPLHLSRTTCDGNCSERFMIPETHARLVCARCGDAPAIPINQPPHSLPTPASFSPSLSRDSPSALGLNTFSSRPIPPCPIVRSQSSRAQRELQ